MRYRPPTAPPHEWERWQDVVAPGLLLEWSPLHDAQGYYRHGIEGADGAIHPHLEAINLAGYPTRESCQGGYKLVGGKLARMRDFNFHRLQRAAGRPPIPVGKGRLLELADPFVLLDKEPPPLRQDHFHVTFLEDAHFYAGWFIEPPPLVFRNRVHQHYMTDRQAKKWWDALVASM